MPGLSINTLPDGVTTINGVSIQSTDGVTTIIDGTTDVFKIAASGTLSLAMTGQVLNASATVSLTGLGYLTATPAVLGFVSGTGNTVIDERSLTDFPLAVVWTAAASGGATTSSALAGILSGNVSSNLDNSPSGHLVVTLYGSNLVFSNTVYARYYALIEAAM